VQFISAGAGAMNSTLPADAFLASLIIAECWGFIVPERQSEFLFGQSELLFDCRVRGRLARPALAIECGMSSLIETRRQSSPNIQRQSTSKVDKMLAKSGTPDMIATPPLAAVLIQIVAAQRYR
jgi:hypothetical protein